MKSRGLLAVEMEAAALYAFAEARGKPVLCLAHVTNQMAQVEGDFEKGEGGGSVDAISVIEAVPRLGPSMALPHLLPAALCRANLRLARTQPARHMRPAAPPHRHRGAYAPISGRSAK